MPTDILLPKVGFASADSTLSRWLVEDGATITAGQPLYELENDKAVQEVEAPATGRLRIIAAVGEAYPIGAVLGVIED